jgi:hypothetical protein
MTAQRKDIKVTVNENTSGRTVTIRWRDAPWYGYKGEWRQVTFPIGSLTKALAEAKVSVPWAALFEAKR